MSKKILLINPNYGGSGSFNVGLAYVASVLRDDYQVTVLNPDLFDRSLSWVKDRMKEMEYDILGISSMVTGYNSVKEISEFSKEINPQVPIILGGRMTSSVPELILEATEVDIEVLGDGEEIMMELVRKIDNDEDWRDAEGIAYQEDGEIKLSWREPPQDLDDLPFPARDFFDYQEIIDQRSPVWRKRAGIITSRGCPGRCTFCYIPNRQRFRLRSAENVLKEVDYISDKYDFNHLSFLDELATFDGDRLKKIAKGFEKRGLTWGCSSRVDSVDEDSLKYISEHGCTHIDFGIESGSDTILKEMNKGVDSTQAEKAVRESLEAGITVKSTFMIGYPSETEETFQETKEFIEKFEPELEGGVFYATPYPGTGLYKLCKNKGLIKDDTAFLKKISGERFDKLHINMTQLSDERLKEMVEELREHLGASFWVKAKNKLPELLRKYMEHPNEVFSHVAEGIKKRSNSNV